MTLRARLTLGILAIALVLVMPMVLTLHAVGALTRESLAHYALAEILAASVLAAAIAVWLTRSVSRPMRDLEAGMRAVAGGEFGHRLAIAPHRRDEFGRLAISFATMADRLAELDKLKAEFVSIASHELKTPINVMLGYLQLMQEGVYGPLSDRQLEVCRTLQQQCQAVGRLSKQLLDVSRFEAGGGQLDLHRFALGPFLDELEESVHVLALQRGVQFSVLRDERLPVEVRWDRDGISEVLGNMLSNAFRFTPAGGHVELAAHADEREVRLYLRDTGSGIPPEQLAHVFDKFYQARNQIGTVGKGMGLGLAIAKSIVEAHRGTISVDSTPGEGTVFSIRLPPVVPPL